jgi:hypothetical protein
MNMSHIDHKYALGDNASWLFKSTNDMCTDVWNCWWLVNAALIPQCSIFSMIVTRSRMSRDTQRIGGSTRISVEKLQEILDWMWIIVGMFFYTYIDVGVIICSHHEAFSLVDWGFIPDCTRHHSPNSQFPSKLSPQVLVWLQSVLYKKCALLSILSPPCLQCIISNIGCVA